MTYLMTLYYQDLHTNTFGSNSFSFSRLLELIGLKSHARLDQIYSGFYDFDTITKIKYGCKPNKIIVYCNGMHAYTIVKIIYNLEKRRYQLRIHRVTIIDAPGPTLTTMLLRFYLLKSPI